MTYVENELMLNDAHVQNILWEREQWVCSGYVPGLEYRHAGSTRYYERIKLREETGLEHLVAQPMRYWQKLPFRAYPGEELRWHLEDEFPILKLLDQDRLHHFEDPPCTGWDCETFGHVMSAAIGNVAHWRWRRSIDRRMPHWTNRDRWIREEYRKGRQP